MLELLNIDQEKHLDVPERFQKKFKTWDYNTKIVNPGTRKGKSAVFGMVRRMSSLSVSKSTDKMRIGRIAEGKDEN